MKEIVIALLFVFFALFLSYEAAEIRTLKTELTSTQSRLEDLAGVVQGIEREIPE